MQQSKSKLVPRIVFSSLWALTKPCDGVAQLSLPLRHPVGQTLALYSAGMPFCDYCQVVFFLSFPPDNFSVSRVKKGNI